MLTKLKEQATEKYNKVFKKEEKEASHVEFKDENEVQDEKQQTPQKPKENTMVVIKQKMTQAGDYIQSKVQAAQETVKIQMQKVDLSVQQQKQSLNKWIASKADDRVMRSLKSVEPKIEQSIDKSMPFLKDFFKDMALSLWRDTSNLIRFELRVSIDKPQMVLSKRPDNNRYLKWWYSIRNWVLYALYPFDLSLSNTVRRPSYLFLKLLEALPYFGIQTFTYFIVFISIDKSEEYQIVNFILDYKNFQFFGSCLLMMFGYLEYFYCATLREMLDNSNGQHIQNHCKEIGPGSTNHIYISLISYFVQIMLIWTAFFQLHRTTSTADFLNVTQKQSRGGRLKHFMIYDLICFTITTLLSIWIYHHYYVNQETFKYISRAGPLIYFAQTFYGILSLPFSIFIIPFFVRMFTTAIPTGYDTFGNVVPIVNNLQLTYQELPLDALPDIDIQEAMA